MLLILTACGGVGTETVKGDKSGGPASGTELEKGLADDKSCTEEVKVSIEKVTELCAANMNVDLDRTLCLAEARVLRSKHPDFVCTLKGGDLIDADYILENFITKIETQKDKLKDSGIFDD